MTEPVAWGVFAKVFGAWVLQYPVRATEADAREDMAMFMDQSVLEVRPLYAPTPAKSPAPHAPTLLRGLAALLLEHDAALGYSNEDQGVEIEIAGKNVFTGWLFGPKYAAKTLLAAADRLGTPPC